MLSPHQPLKDYRTNQPFTISRPDWSKSISKEFSFFTMRKEIRNWLGRVENWKDEFRGYVEIVNRHLNEAPKHNQDLKQHYAPLKISVEQELPKLEVELAYLGNFIEQDSLHEILSSDPQVRWTQLEQQLHNFESAHHLRKKRFLAMLLHRLPLKIF